MSDDPFNLTEFALTPEQAAKLAPLQKKPGGKPEAKPARQKAAKLTKTWAQFRTIKVSNWQSVLEIQHLLSC